MARAQAWPEALADQALAALGQHRMLTAEQLREMLTPDASGTANWSRRLNRLRRHGLVDALTSPGGAWRAKVWHPTRTGLQRLPAHADVTRSRATTPASGVLAAHTLAVNTVGLAFVRAARAQADECDWTSWDNEVAHSFAATRRHATLIADALVSYTIVDWRSRPLQWFIELDRATQPAHKLAAKVHMYANYHRWIPARPDAYGVPAGEPAWRGRYPRWPTLCVVIGANPTKDEAAIERRVWQVIDLCEADRLIQAEAIPVLLCSFEALTRHGPWAGIWRKLSAPEDLVDAAGRPRS